MTTRSFTPEQVEALRAQFDVMDQNGDGRITASELEALLQREAYRHLDDEQRLRILRSYASADTNDDGGVDFDEFLAMVSREREQDGLDALRQSFDAYDLDGDGFLTADEFRRIAAQQGEALTEEQAAAMIAMADRNQDGKVSFEEFRAIMNAATSG